MSVAWRSLTLAGFGPFENEVEVEFDDGVNVLIAPNESGKSTLAAGLTAVLFGLPGTSNPNEFSQARYRNWNDPSRFEGTLVFEADGQVYRIRRRFGTHAVTVSRRTEAGWEIVLEGEHNPRARRANVAYEKFLQRTVGVVSRELFTATFAFTQPLPAAERLNDDVQALVTGAGSARFSHALERLISEGRRLSKYTKAMGLSARDAVNDGQLQRVDARIAALREAVEASRAAVDERQAIQQDLSRTQAELAAVRRELEQTERELEAWTRRQTLQDERRAALQRQSQLQRAWETYRSLETELKARRRALKEEFPELAGAPADTGRLLEELSELQSELEAGRGQLETELAALRRRAGELLDEWRQFAETRQRWSALKARLRAEYAPFEESDDEARGFCASYGATKAALQLRLERVRTELERRREAEETLAREQARFTKTYGDLDELQDDAVEAVDEHIALLLEREQASAELEAERVKFLRSRRRKIGLRLVGAVAAAAAAVVGGIAGSSETLWVIVPAAAMTLLLALGAVSVARTFVSTPELDRLAARLNEIDDVVAGDGRLGSYTGLPVPDLRALRERLLARRQAAAALAERTAAFEPVGDELLGELDEAEQALRRFMKATAPARERFGDDVERAYARWAALREEEARARSELVSFSRRHFGVETTEPERLPVGELGDAGVPGAWREVARLLEDSGRPSPDTVGLLVAEAEGLNDEAVAKAAAVRFDARPGLARDRRRVEDLTERLANVLGAAGGDVAAARQRWSEYRRAAAAAEMVEKELRGVLAGHGAQSDEELHTRSLEAANQALDARRRLAELAEEHVSLPGPDEDITPADVRAKLQELSDRRDELQRRRAGGEERLLKLREQLADVSGRRVINVAEAELELKELEAERARLAREVDVVALAYRELRNAADAFRRTHRERLAEKTGEYLRHFTGRDRSVVLDENFRVEIQDPDGPRHAVGQLSRGAQDQLYLALRLAIADMVADDVALPLFLDDPFVNCDDERLARIRDALAALGGGRQVVLFSHHDAFSDWGTPLTLRTKPAAGR